MKAENDYTTSESEEVEDSGGWWIPPLLIAILIGTIVFFAHDSLMNESKVWVQLTLKADCDYVIPDGFEILSDGKLFVTRHKTSFGWEYLCGSQDNIKAYGINISKPTYLYSECKARAYIKKYLKQDSIEDLSNFKKVEK